MTFLLGLAERMQAARLAVVLDPSEFGLTNLHRRDAGLGPLAHGLFGAGVDLLQLRSDADKPDTALSEAIELVRTVSYDYQGLVSVSDDVETAAQASIDVVHLDRSPIRAKDAAARQHEWALVGRSCRSREDVDAAVADEDVAYFFVEAELFRYAAHAAPVSAEDAKPWFAVGGVTLDTLDEALDAGARRVCIAPFEAGRSGSAADPVAVAQEFKGRLSQAWRDDPDLPELGAAAGVPQPRFRRPGE